MDGYVERLKDIDALNHVLGSYVAVGVNNPKKYPKEPNSVAQERRSASAMTTDAELDRYICAKYGGKNGSKN